MLDEVFHIKIMNQSFTVGVDVEVALRFFKLGKLLSYYSLKGMMEFEVDNDKNHDNYPYQLERFENLIRDKKIKFIRLLKDDSILPIHY